MYDMLFSHAWHTTWPRCASMEPAFTSGVLHTTNVRPFLGNGWWHEAHLSAWSAASSIVVRMRFALVRASWVDMGVSRSELGRSVLGGSRERRKPARGRRRSDSGSRSGARTRRAPPQPRDTTATATTGVWRDRRREGRVKRTNFVRRRYAAPYETSPSIARASGPFAWPGVERTHRADGHHQQPSSRSTAGQPPPAFCALARRPTPTFRDHFEMMPASKDLKRSLLPPFTPSLLTLPWSRMSIENAVVLAATMRSRWWTSRRPTVFGRWRSRRRRLSGSHPGDADGSHLAAALGAAGDAAGLAARALRASSRLERNGAGGVATATSSSRLRIASALVL